MYDHDVFEEMLDTGEERRRVRKMRRNYRRGFDPFRDPGGMSALRAGARLYPCPTCGKRGRLSAADKAHGYQCDECADRAEGRGF